VSLTTSPLSLLCLFLPSYSWAGVELQQKCHLRLSCPDAVTAENHGQCWMTGRKSELMKITWVGNEPQERNGTRLTDDGFHYSAFLSSSPFITRGGGKSSALKLPARDPSDDLTTGHGPCRIPAQKFRFWPLQNTVPSIAAFFRQLRTQTIPSPAS
jgi:hypothetical protein